MGSDDHVAFGLAVVAHALHAVDLGQVMDDLAVFSVHGWETVGSLWLFSLISELHKILDLLFYPCDKLQVFSGVLFEAVAVYRGRAGVKGVRGGVDLQRLGQTPVSLQSSTLLVTFKPALFQFLLCEEWADVHRVAELHVRQFTGHGDGCIPLI